MIMKLLFLHMFFTVALIGLSVQERVDRDIIGSILFGHNRKRQSVSPSCVIVYVSLTSDERDCFGLNTDPSSNEPSSDEFSVNQLERLCSSQLCVNAAKKVLVGCKSLIDEQLPVEYQGVDLAAFFDLFCTRTSDNSFCYSNLPLISGNLDPIQSCQSVLSGGGCGDDCQQALQQYSSTCCFASYLELLPSQNNFCPTNLWNMCHVTTPQFCNPSDQNPCSNTDTPATGTAHPVNGDNSGGTNKSSTGSNTDGSSSAGTDKSDDHLSLKIGVVVGASLLVVLIIVLVPVVVIGLIIYYKRKDRSSYSGDNTMRMSLAFNEDPDD